MRHPFQKAFFDRSLFSQIEGLFYQEGFIKSDSLRREKIREDEIDRLTARRPNKSSLLRDLVLFERIDTEYSDFDFEFAVNTGIVDFDSNLLKTQREEVGEPRPELEGDIEFYQFCQASARKIILEEKPRVISLHRRQSPRGYYVENTSGMLPELSTSIIRYFDGLHFSEYHGAVPVAVLEAGFELCCELACREDFNPPVGAAVIHGSDIDIHPVFWALAEDVFFLWNNLTNSLYRSTDGGSVFCSQLFRGNSPIFARSERDIVENVYYFFRTDLQEEIAVLPAPKSLSEALSLREKPQIHRFREVLGEWVEAMYDGSSRLERKIRRDIALANRDIKLVGKYKEVKDSRFNFWLQAIGGHIPILSNVLTVENALGSVISDRVAKRASWIKLHESSY